jgi:uncharacterized protein
MLAHSVAPFRSFIVKIASRCNLNCSYCFIYNREDERWKRQPALMSQPTVKCLAERIKDHCTKHSLAAVDIVLHGGEPLLGGPNHLAMIGETINSVFANSGVEVGLGMQSNGILFDDEIGATLLRYKISVGISVDGPADVNDAFRVDHQGAATSAKLEAALRLLCSHTYRPIFSGFLCVVNVEADPLRVYSYLDSFDPPGIDLILPFDNHDRWPPGKSPWDNTRYADWLIAIFDEWFFAKKTTPVRIFKSLLRLILGGRSLVESVGTDPVDLVVVETNGEIEAVDSLKSTFNGATNLGYNIFENSFDEVLAHTFVMSRQMGADSLCDTCRKCPNVQYCGGGYLPNRYSSKNGFNNPSVYCSDLYKLIEHIKEKVQLELRKHAIITD